VVAVDKVAASGGYLMAAVANRIIAAPFAVLGSIGVVAQIPNVHRLLKRHDVDVEVLTAGKYKRTLTVLGENTEEGRQKFIEELEDVHRLFQDYVGTRRAQLDLDAVATGETWYGQQALDMKLVDDVLTSDEYLVQQSEHADIYEVRWVEHKRPLERIMAQMESSASRVAGRWVERISQWRGGL
jgi:serine protease SohB